MGDKNYVMYLAKSHLRHMKNFAKKLDPTGDHIEIIKEKGMATDMWTMFSNDNEITEKLLKEFDEVFRKGRK